MSETPTDRDPWNVARIDALAPDPKVLAAARGLLRSNAFSQVEPTADGRGWEAICQDADLHRATVRNSYSSGFECECECPSWKNPCKHALALLLHLSAHPDLRTLPDWRAPKKPVTHAPMEFEALVRAIFANPDDDTPRLVFADYLDENGQPDRAALIRLQCGIAGSRKSAEKDRLARLRAEIAAPKDFVVHVRRGFVCLEVTLFEFWWHAPKEAQLTNLFQNGWVETVRFAAQDRSEFTRQFPDTMRTLLRLAGCLDFTAVRLTDAQLAQLATDLRPGTEGSRLTQVLVHSRDANLYAAFLRETRPAEPVHVSEHQRSLDVTADQFRLLLRAGQLAGVTELSLSGASAGDRALTALAADEHLRLTHLSISGAVIGAEGGAALAGASWFPALERLRIIDGRLDDDALAALGHGTPTRLVRFELTGAEVRDGGITALTAAAFPALQTFHLSKNRLTANGAAALLRSENFPALTEVVFTDNPIPPARWADLVLSAHERPQFEARFLVARESVTRTISGGEVRLTVPHKTGATLEELGACPELARVTALVLHDHMIDAGAAATLAAGLAQGQLRELDLSGCGLDDPVSALVRFCAAPNLTALILTRMGLKYPVIARLALQPVVAKLRTLDLSDNPLGPTGLDAILSSPHLRGVERFVFRGAMSLSQREREHFQKQFGPRAEF